MVQNFAVFADGVATALAKIKTTKFQWAEKNDRVSNRKYESLQIQSTTAFPSRSTLGMIETIPQIGKALEKIAPNAILNC